MDILVGLSLELSNCAVCGLRMKLGLSVPVELPDVDSVILCSGNDHTVVEWVEYRID